MRIIVAVSGASGSIYGYTLLSRLRRNPDVKWRRSANDIAASATRQREILAAAAGMVKPGGRLVYATCSLEPAENEMVTQTYAISASHAGKPSTAKGVGNLSLTSDEIGKPSSQYR